MDGMTGFLLGCAIGLVIIIIDSWLNRKFPCSCGRSRAWYFEAQHERAGLMLARCIYVTGWTVVLLVTSSWFLGPIFALLTTWWWRRWWFHEKDKLKKKAAKTAGAVGFNQHGKLVVVNNK